MNENIGLTEKQKQFALYGMKPGGKVKVNGDEFKIIESKHGKLLLEPLTCPWYYVEVAGNETKRIFIDDFKEEK